MPASFCRIRLASAFAAFALVENDSLRLRKEEYGDDELKTWAERVAAGIDSGHDVYCYFKHEEKGIGPIYAERLGQLLG